MSLSGMLFWAVAFILPCLMNGSLMPPPSLCVLQSLVVDSSDVAAVVTESVTGTLFAAALPMPCIAGTRVHIGPGDPGNPFARVNVLSGTLPTHLME